MDEHEDYEGKTIIEVILKDGVRRRFLGTAYMMGNAAVMGPGPMAPMVSRIVVDEAKEYGATANQDTELVESIRDGLSRGGDAGVLVTLDGKQILVRPRAAAFHESRELQLLRKGTACHEPPVEASQPGAEGAIDPGRVLIAGLYHTVPEAFSRLYNDMMFQVNRLDDRANDLESDISNNKRSDSWNHSEAFSQIDALNHRISALEALAAPAPQKRSVSVYRPLNGPEIRVEVVERDHG